MEAFISINKNNTYLLQEFLTDAGNSTNNFRYYNNRGFESINNHLTTLIYIVDNLPVAYGHLDEEDNTIWLGIAVVEQHKGKGYGIKMMNELMNIAKKLNLDIIKLSVDKENKKALSLYIKFGFKIVKEKEQIFFLEKQIQ